MEELQAAVAAVRAAQPGLGVKKLCAEVKKDPRFAGFGAKEIRQAVAALEKQAAPEPEPEPEPEPQAEAAENRAQRRARMKEEKAAKKAQKVKPAQQSPDALTSASHDGRKQLAGALWSTATEGEHDNGVLSPETVAFQGRVKDFLRTTKDSKTVEEVRATLDAVVELDTQMKKLQASLAAEGEKANKNWRICSANLSHATDARKIFTFSQKAEEAKQRVLRFNSDVKAFNECREWVYRSPAHQQAREFLNSASVTLPDGSMQLKSTMQEDEELSDFEKLAQEMHATGGLEAAAAGDKLADERRANKEGRILTAEEQAQIVWDATIGRPEAQDEQRGAEAALAINRLPEAVDGDRQAALSAVREAPADSAVAQVQQQARERAVELAEGRASDSLSADEFRDRVSAAMLSSSGLKHPRPDRAETQGLPP